MESVNRFGPELILLSAAGVITLADIGWALAGTRAEGARRGVLAALALAGAAASIGWAALLIALGKLLGAISSAVTLYGMAFLFGLSGSTSLDEIAAAVRSADGDTRSALVLAAVFLMAGFGFKMAIVPFQMWVPDVYEGAPTPVTAYLSVGSKAAGFAVVMRVFLSALGDGSISS